MKHRMPKYVHIGMVRCGRGLVSKRFERCIDMHDDRLGGWQYWIPIL